MKKALITILGIQGGRVQNEKAIIFNFSNKAKYYFENDEDNKLEYFNTLPFLLEKYQENYDIVPIYTDEAKIFTNEVVEKYKQEGKSYNFNYPQNGYIKDEKDIDAIFSILHNIFSQYDKVIVDVTHGFRHLPLLMIVELIMQHFANNEKIEKILFAKEKIKHDQQNQGLYELIDLKRYAELANISFILTNFEKNYTVANHIKSKPYHKLIKALNSFSEDIMALNLKNLYSKSAPELIDELKKIKDVSIKHLAQNLANKIETLTDYKNKKRYQSYFILAKDLFEKNYMLLSLSLLFESSRLYIKTTIKKEHPKIVQDIEKKLNNDLYKVGFFFKNLKWKTYEKYKKEKNKIDITEQNYNTLKSSFPSYMKRLYNNIDSTRNNLAHANSGKRFKEIKEDIKNLFDDFEEKCMKKRYI